MPPHLPRIRQVVLAARDLDPVANTLRDALHLGEPFSDPAVEHFGLRNAVFALGDTFIEVVSPVRRAPPGPGAGAARTGIGALPGIAFDAADDDEPGLTEIRISAPHDPFELAGVRFEPVSSDAREPAQ